jgi:Zn-dependent peptidase ImmA (M78 family)/DNA-binding XRE family transcriptional regulator
MAIAPRIEALVKTELLLWGRESAGLSVGAVAKKVGVKPDRIVAWESGDERPSIPQLRKLADAYKRPLAAFYLPAPPPPIERPRDFRRAPGEGLGKDSPALLLEMRRAIYRREVAVELLDELDEEAPALPITAHPNDDPEELGAQIRGLLGVSYEQQVAWRNDLEAFRSWRAALEDQGVLVFLARKVEPTEMDGFSISHWPLPVVVVNDKNHERRRIFTMLHEFAHVLLREGGICDLDEDPRHPTDTRSVEVFCNRVAGAALVPMDCLLDEEVVQGAQDRSAFRDDEIVSLARRYKASREAILRRLLMAGRITEQFYLGKRQQYQQEPWLGKSGGRALPHTKALNTLGRLFPRLVLEGYGERRITASDLSEYLGLRLKHLPKLEATIHSSSGRGPVAS